MKTALRVVVFLMVLAWGTSEALASGGGGMPPPDPNPNPNPNLTQGLVLPQ